MGYAWKLGLDLHDALRFCRCGWFWRLHFGLWREYQKHSLSRQEGSFTYGETPTSTMVEVLRNLGLTPGQRIVDLGSGRGLPTLVAASLGYQAFGLEYFGEHVERAQRVSDRLGLSAHFQAGDFLTNPWPAAEAYFICSTAFQLDLREALRVCLTRVAAKAWIVTQDWNLIEPEEGSTGNLSYTPRGGSPFQLVRSQKLPVTWGTSTFRYFRRTADGVGSGF